MKFYVLALIIFSVSRPSQSSTTTLPSPPPTPSPSAPESSNTTELPSNAIPAGTATTLPQGANAGGSPGGNGSPPFDPDLAQWARCLSKAPVDSPLNNSVPSLFMHWCSNYETVIPCIRTGLSTDAANNPMDFFVKLHFDADTLMTTSEKLCPSFQGVSDRRQCLRGINVTLANFCRHRFSAGLHYVYDAKLRKAFANDPNVYKEIACQVTRDTTSCLGAAMATCDVEFREHVLAYYAVFTNESCLANQSEPYNIPTPPPPRPPPSHGTNVVTTCARQVTQTLPQSGPPLANNASQVEQLVHGLSQLCRSFEARYSCYDEELDRITNPTFHDMWLSYTFDSRNAVKSQKEFCQAFEGGVVGSLTTECYNRTQSKLLQCETTYAQYVAAIEQQWVNNRLNSMDVRHAACGSSVRRAFCLRDAFRMCGNTLAETMLDSELGTLPDICFTAPSNGKHGSAPSDNDSTSSGREPFPAAETTGYNHHSDTWDRHGSHTRTYRKFSNKRRNNGYGYGREPIPASEATGYDHHPGTNRNQPPSGPPDDTGLSTGETNAEGRGQGAGGASGLMCSCSMNITMLLAMLVALSSRLL